MISPALSAARFAIAVLMGMGLGLIYGFLRPLRPRLTALADLIFVLAAAAAWVYLGFAVCLGDLRLGYTAGLIIGGIGWEMTIGRLLRPVFWGIWWPLRKIFRFFNNFSKKLFASAKKWVTIYWSKNHHRTAKG